MADDFHHVGGAGTKLSATAQLLVAGMKGEGSDAGSGVGNSTTIFGQSQHSSSKYGQGDTTNSQQGLLERALSNILTIYRVQQHNVIINLCVSFAAFLFLVQSLSIPLQPPGGFPQSSWPYALRTALTVIRTFASPMTPFGINVYVVVMPAIAFVHAIVYILLPLAWRLRLAGKIDLAQKVALGVKVLCFINFLFALPIMYFATAYIECNYGKEKIILSRYEESNITCYDFTTGTGALAILGYVICFSQMFLASFWVIISVNTNPLHRSCLIGTDTPYVFVAESMINIFATMVYAVCSGNSIVALPPIRHGLYFIAMLLHLVNARGMMPFYNGVVNSLYFGFVCARTLLPFALLILDTSFANQVFGQSSYDIALPIVFCVSIFVGFVIGVTIVSIQQIVAMSKARSFVKLLAYSASVDDAHHEDVDVDALNKNNLSMGLGEIALKLLLPVSAPAKTERGVGEKFEKLLQALQSAHFQKQSCGLTIIEATFFIYSQRSSNYGHLLCRRALYKEKPGIFQRIKIYYLMNTLETSFTDFTKEQKLNKMLKGVIAEYYGILILYKQFWKVTSEERGVVAQLKLGGLMDALYKTRSHVDDLWAKIFHEHPNDPKVLKAYAKFMEEVEDNQAGAASMREQAASIEVTHEKSGRRTRGKIGKSLITGAVPILKGNMDQSDEQKQKQPGMLTMMGRNKIHPSPRMSQTSSPRGEETTSNADENRSEKDVTEENVEQLEREMDDLAAQLDGRTMEASRKEVFRQAIEQKRQRNAQISITIGALVFSLLALTLLFILVQVTSSSVTLTSYASASCDIQDAAYEGVRMLRSIQLENEIGYVNQDIRAEFNRVVYLSLNKTAMRISEFLDEFWLENSQRISWTKPEVPVRLPVAKKNIADVHSDSDIYAHQTNSLIDSITAYYKSLKNVYMAATNRSLAYGTRDVGIIYGTDSDPHWQNSLSLVLDFDFMYVYLNAYEFSNRLHSLCSEAITSFVTTASMSVPIFYCLMAAIIVGRIASVIFFTGSALSVVGERRKFITMLLHGIPKDVSSKMFRDTGKVLADASSFYKVQIEELPQFSSLKNPKPNQLLVARPFLLYILILVLEIVFLAVSIATFQQTYNLGVSKASIFETASSIKSIGSYAALVSTEYFYNGQAKLFSFVDEFNSNATAMAESVRTIMKDMEQSKMIMRYGENDSGGMIQSGNADIIQFLRMGSCATGSNSSLTAKYGLGTRGQITPVYQSCVSSVRDIFFSSETDLSAINAYPSCWFPNGTLNPTPLASPSLKDKISNIFFSTVQLGEAMDFVNALYAASSANSMTTAIIVLYVIFFILISMLWVLCFITFKQLLDRDHYTRLILAWVPPDTIEQERAINNFVMQHSLSGGASNRELQKEQDDKTRSILQACVDGVVIVSSSRIITDVNRSTTQMLNASFADVVGLRFEEIVSQRNHKQIDTVMKYLLAKADSHRRYSTAAGKMEESSDHLEESVRLGNGELQTTTIDISCTRKDKTEFPARVSFSLASMGKKTILAVFIKDITLEKKQQELLQLEKANSEQLLLNVLPRSIAARLKSGETNIADRFEDVTVLFSDMCGFTAMSGGLTPQELIIMLNTIVTCFDDLTKKYHIEKIKTIGDAFFAVGGLSSQLGMVDDQNDNFAKMSHAEQVCRMGIEMMAVVKRYNKKRPSNIPEINVRVGINSGPITGGVIGKFKYIFDCFGDTVNVASRMESTSLPGYVQLSRETYQRVFDLFKFREKSDVFVKGKGNVTTYILLHEEEPAFIEGCKIREEMDEPRQAPAEVRLAPPTNDHFELVSDRSEKTPLV